MARRLGVHPGIYVRWERGENIPSIRAHHRVLAEIGGGAPASIPDSLGGRLRAWRRIQGLSQGGRHGPPGSATRACAKSNATTASPVASVRRSPGC